MIYIIFALIVMLGVQDYMNRRDRLKLIEAILAKDLREFKDKPVKVKENEEVVAPDVPVDVAEEEDFDRAIRQEVGRPTLADRAKRFARRKRG